MKVATTGSAFILAVVLLLEMLRPVVAISAQDPADLYARGIAAYGQKQYDAALAHFVAAYNLSEQSDILFNIAICHERLRDFERAVAYYEIYLEEKPDAADAATIRERIHQLQAAMAEGTEPPPFPAPEQPEEPDKAEEQAPKRIVRTDVPTIQVESPDAPNPLLWPSIGVTASGFVLISGTITGISAIKKYNGLEGDCAPNCSDDEVQPARALAIAADVQLAVGLVGAAVSAYFLVRARKEKPPARSPETSLSFLGTGVSWALSF